MRWAVVGCGLIGTKRVAALRSDDVLVCAADVDAGRARSVASLHPEAIATTDWQAAVARPDVDAVIVATTHDWLAPVSLLAVDSGKHVLVEKPGARTKHELDEVAELSRRNGRYVHVGFNHRYHPAISYARRLVVEGAIGPTLYVRARYGHGGRLGYEREWRADPVVSGGGELIDQGIHLIDLARWFLGDFHDVVAVTPTYFWDMQVEDNAFLMLRTPGGQVAWLHASWTEWKNMFCFEIVGRDGKLQVDGLGGSYGTETLTWYKMLPELGPPEVTVWEYPGVDDSWTTEMDAFVSAAEGGHATGEPAPDDSLSDALAALAIVQQAYAQVSTEWSL